MNISKPTYEELEQRNRELENELFLYKTIIDNVPISVFAKDVQDEYKYIIWNKELERIFGTKAKDIIGINDFQLFENKEEAKYFNDYDISVMQGREIIDIPAEDLRTVEGVKIVHTRKIPVYDEENQPKILLGCLEDITQKVINEQELIRNKHHLHSIFESMTDLLFVLDKNGVFIEYYNPNDLENLYAPPELFLNNNYEQVLPPEIAEKIKKAILLIKETGTPQSLDYSIEVQNTVQWFNAKISQIQDINDEFAGVTIIARNITERKQAEQAIQENEARFRHIINKSTDVIWTQDLSFHTTYMSPSVERLLGYTVDEYLALPVSDRLPAESVPIAVKQLTENLQKVKSGEVDVTTHTFIFEMLHKHKNGELIWGEVNCSFLYDDNKNVTGLHGITRDISQRKHAEQALKASEKRYRQIVEMIGEGIAFVDAEENFVSVNSSAQKIFDLGDGELVGMNLSFFLPNNEREKIEDQTRLHKQGIHNSYDLEIVTAKGNRKSIIVTATPHFDNENIFLGTYGVFRDITQRIQTEQILKESEAQSRELIATKDRLFSIIAHDLRNPFNSILGFAVLLKSNIRKYKVEKSEHFLEIIISSAQNTLNLLGNLLDWAKTQTGKITYEPKNLKLQTIILDVVSITNSSALIKDIFISCHLSNNIDIYTDEEMLKTILRNLLSNAIKFTDTGGKIEVYAIKKQDYIEITVSDNGVGMDAETSSKLFNLETNVTKKGTAGEKGTGLGLILCKEFVEKHGGKIWCESEAGKGSTFKFTLPVGG